MNRVIVALVIAFIALAALWFATGRKQVIQQQLPPQQDRILPKVLPVPLPPTLQPTQAFQGGTYEGTWVTTNRRLDGTMTGVVTPNGDNKWRSRFYGVWQGRSFDYTIDFTGPPEKVQGTAVIDHADYTWTGAMSDSSFTGSFTGSRYTGHFELKRK